MALILDASATLAWMIARTDVGEAALADKALHYLRSSEALIPLLWYSEVSNGILIAERHKVVSSVTSSAFLDLLNDLPIREDSVRPSVLRDKVLSLARTYSLTAYDTVYLELALRTGSALATFDRQLAKALRKAGGRIFGDRA